MTEKELLIKISGKVDNSLNTVSGKVDKAFNNMTKAAKALGVAGAAAVAGATAAAINAGKDYEAQMSTVQAISGATEKEFEALNKKAQEMGSTTKFTATESGQAMEYMAMAGWKTEDMLGGIEGIMNLAAASGEDLASTSDIVTDALTAFGLSAEDSGHFADVLAKASSASNTNVAMMGETFKYAASVAGALGYSVEDTSVSIGLMANSGIKASQAGTTLRKLMNETAGGIELVSKAYAKNGEKTGKMQIQTANADGSMKDWSKTVAALRKEFSKMTEEEQAANAEAIGGKTAMAGLLAIVNASEKDYKKLTKEINNASGATEKMAQIQLDNLEGDITLFQSALEGKGIALYEEIKEPLRDVVQDATQLLEEIDVARVVDEFQDFGEAVLDFAEPLIETGEWMLENPEAISGVLSGIGGAITGYKLLDAIPKLGDEIDLLMKGISASPYIAGGALAVGAIIGLGVAITETEKAAAKASLDEHFGDVALSMKEIDNAASQIVGSRKLESVGELFDNIDASEDLLGDLEDASDAIKKIDWKLSVGLKIDDEDMSNYEKNVQEYISTAQELIDQNGYTINVATEILFGDSKEGKQIIKDNNAFYASLDQQAGDLSKKINKKLKKAMKDGLTVDLQEEIDSLLGQLTEITNAITSAEAEASWETLAAEFSGKEMNEETFAELQESIEENLAKVNEGALSALQESNTNLLAQKKLGYITEDEYISKKNANEAAYKNTTDNATKKALEFQYNTLMDTYGEIIASGNYDAGDKTAIQRILDPMLKEAETVDTELYNKLLDISIAATPGMQNSILSFVNGVYGKQQNQPNIYEIANTGAQEAANEYLNPKNNKEEKVSVALNLQGKNANEIDFADILLNPAKEGGEKASKEIRNTMQSELKAGISLNVPIMLNGTYSLSAGNTNSQKATSNKKGSSSSVLFPPLPGHASGIISNKQHLAMVSENNKTEAIIPIDGSERSRRLYEATGKLMGAGNSNEGTVISPVFHIHVSGSANRQDAQNIASMVEKEVDKMLKKKYRDNKRFNMAQ